MRCSCGWTISGLFAQMEDNDVPRRMLDSHLAGGSVTPFPRPGQYYCSFCNVAIQLDGTTSGYCRGHGIGPHPGNQLLVPMPPMISEDEFAWRIRRPQMSESQWRELNRAARAAIERQVNPPLVVDTRPGDVTFTRSYDQYEALEAPAPPTELTDTVFRAAAEKLGYLPKASWKNPAPKLKWETPWISEPAMMPRRVLRIEE